MTPVFPAEDAPMSATVEYNARPAPDQALVDIARYVAGYAITSATAWDTARLCLMDSLPQNPKTPPQNEVNK